jgi:hypothetical protein
MSARDPLQELEKALSFPVSPDFCARVRQQVAVEPMRSRMWFGPRLALAASVILAIGIGVVTTLRQLDVEVARVAVPEPGFAPPVRSAPDLHLPRVPQRSAGVAASKIVMRFETVVPDDQLRALDRLLASMREGRATVPPLVSDDDEVDDRGQRVLRALVIEPVTIELLAGTPADPNKNPVKDPNK